MSRDAYLSPAGLRINVVSADVETHTTPQYFACGIKEKTKMPTGTIKWFNATKGYGFISPNDGGSDVFVHITAVQTAGLQGLEENQVVNYELAEGRNGKKNATNLSI